MSLQGEAVLQAALVRIEALAQGREAGLETPFVRLQVAGSVATTALAGWRKEQEAKKHRL